MKSDQLRSQHRSERAALGDAAQREHAISLLRRVGVLTEYKNATHIAAYIAIRGEIDLGPLLQNGEDKRFYLPVLRGQNMHFAPWQPGGALEQKEFGLLEPEVAESRWIDPRQLDLVLVPLVVFDARGNRIGQGGGYYDRTFEFKRLAATQKPLLLGVAHDTQRESQLSPQVWDVPLDLIATDRKLYRPVSDR